MTTAMVAMFNAKPFGKEMGLRPIASCDPNLMGLRPIASCDPNLMGLQPIASCDPNLMGLRPIASCDPNFKGLRPILLFCMEIGLSGCTHNFLGVQWVIIIPPVKLSAFSLVVGSFFLEELV